MSTCFLTGATGVIGSFLVSQALAEGRPLAVLARDKGPIPAAKRLPSGVKVLKGDLTRPKLGLSKEDLNWVQENCQQVIHAGASVRFLVDESSGEPYRSNIDGMRHTLQLCQNLGLKKLALVSTAYVCGDRAGIIAEDELECGQGFNNAYERSKLVAETLAHQASFLDKLQVFRPSVVVGDSRTGEIPAFHTIYEVLRLAWMSSGQSGTELLESLGLDPEIAINLVPADWVASAIWDGLEHTEPRSTFHLTHSEPVKLGQILNVLDQFKKDSPKLSNVDISASRSLQPLVAYMRQHPTFESSVSSSPPIMTEAVLSKLLAFAIELGFKSKRDWVELSDALKFPMLSDQPGELKVKCLDGPESWWHFGPKNVCRAEASDVESSVYLRAGVFEALLNRETSLKSSLVDGHVTFESEDVEQTERLFRDLIQQLGVPV